MAVKPASSTTVGASPRGATRPAGAKGAGGDGLRARKAGGSTTAGTRTTRTAAASGNTGGMWRFYSDDSPGVRVGPVPVLVMSLVFIASVFILHIWGKYSRG